MVMLVCRCWLFRVQSEVSKKALQIAGRRHILGDAAPCSTVCDMDRHLPKWTVGQEATKGHGHFLMTLKHTSLKKENLRWSPWSHGWRGYRRCNGSTEGANTSPYSSSNAHVLSHACNLHILCKTDDNEPFHRIGGKALDEVLQIVDLYALGWAWEGA
jgi:hypothetical protein